LLQTRHWKAAARKAEGWMKEIGEAIARKWDVSAIDEEAEIWDWKSMQAENNVYEFLVGISLLCSSLL
jgi:hypothetical protein